VNRGEVEPFVKITLARATFAKVGDRDLVASRELAARAKPAAWGIWVETTLEPVTMRQRGWLKCIASLAAAAARVVTSREDAQHHLGRRHTDSDDEREAAIVVGETQSSPRSSAKALPISAAS